MTVILSTRRSFIGGLASLFAAPAIVHAQNIMPVRSILLPLADVSFDCFDKFIPEEASYQWASTEEMWGRSALSVMKESGWREVAADRYRSQFAIGGSMIEHGGCVLLEKPKSMVIAAQSQEVAKAHHQVESWANRVRGMGLSGEYRTSNGWHRI